MALFDEKTYTSSDGGDYLPIIKFNAQSGRVTRRDYAGSAGEYNQTDITKNFKAVFDFENIEVGTIDFGTGGAPSFSVVKLGQPVPAAPTANHKPGFRVLVFLAKECGGDLREFASTAKACLKGLDQLHTAYTAGVKENPGKLPIVVLEDTVAIVTGEGAKKSTAYSPVFTIQRWVDRPAGLTYTPRSQSDSKPQASSTSVSASPATQNSVADDDGFG